jgi:hypothetical protein
MPLDEAQEVLAQLPEHLSQDKQPPALTQSGNPVPAILPWAPFESPVETLEFMSDPSLRSAVQDDLKGTEEQSLGVIEELLTEFD